MTLNGHCSDVIDAALCDHFGTSEKGLFELSVTL